MKILKTLALIPLWIVSVVLVFLCLILIGLSYNFLSEFLPCIIGCLPK